MLIKVFFEDKPVYITDNITPQVTALKNLPGTVFIDDISTPVIRSFLNKMGDTSISGAIVYHDHLEKARRAFYKHFKIIKAAGGVVKNEKDQVLFIYRRGKWDLPKGKNDTGETAKDCGLREVKEETGLQEVKAGKHICTSYHVYNERETPILKETDWFYMKASSTAILIPQHEESIEKIEWTDASRISEMLKNSYALIADVLLEAGIVY